MPNESESESVNLLRELVQWQRFQNRPLLRARLEEVLSGDTDREIYSLTDGTRSQPEIAAKVQVSQPTISNKWKTWRSLGIVYELADEPGRCKHLASLEAVGLKI